MSALYTHTHTYTGLRHDIKHFSMQYSVGLSSNRGRWQGSKKANKLRQSKKKKIHEYQHHGFCMALKYLPLMRHHAEMVAKKRRKKNKPTIAHQLILKGPLTVSPCPLITTKYAQTAAISTCSMNYMASLFHHTL